MSKILKKNIEKGGAKFEIFTSQKWGHPTVFDVEILKFDQSSKLQFVPDFHLWLMDSGDEIGVEIRKAFSVFALILINPVLESKKWLK